MPDLTPGLSCYTANLHAYLAAEWDATALVADSVRLAVRDGGGPLVFSHHAPPLDRLPDGSRLAYAGTDSPADARSRLAAELDARSRVLVLVDHARLPWSATYGGRSAPHWLLLDGRRGTGWHAVDTFRAVLPDGAEQRGYRGPVDTAALTVPLEWTPAQQRRTTLAFGAPVPVPAAAHVWLRRVPDGRAGPGPAGVDRWVTGRAALDLIAERLTAPEARLDAHLDDLWAAAGHHCFAYGRRLAGTGDGPAKDALAAAGAAWGRLPKLLRVAAESAARGRPRPALVRAALAEVRDVEGAP